ELEISGVDPHADAAALTRADLDALRALPGVTSVANTNMVPFGTSTWTSGIAQSADDSDTGTSAGLYVGGPGLLDTLGVTLIEGRDFTADEYIEFHDLRAQ